MGTVELMHPSASSIASMSRKTPSDGVVTMNDSPFLISW
jgi:hypothetical protein